MRRYAEGTTVPLEQTRLEIERLVKKNGGTGWGFLEKGATEIVTFEMAGIRLRFSVRVPDREEMRRTPGGQPRYGRDIERAVVAEHWRRWRVLLLCIKSKLELVSSGAVSLQEEFLSHVVTDDGQTVWEWLGPHLGQIGAGGVLALPAGRI